MMSNRSVRILLSAALLTSLVGCGNTAPVASASTEARAVELGADTPESLIARIQAAAAAGDVRELAASLTPESRRQMAEEMFGASAMMVVFFAMMPAMGGMMGEMAEGMAETLGDEEGVAKVREAVAEDPELAAATETAEQVAARFDEILIRYGLPSLDDEEDGMAGPEGLRQHLESVDTVALIGDLGDFFLSMAEHMGEENGSPSPLPGGELTDLVIKGDRATGKIGDQAVELVRVEGRWFANLDMEGQ